MTEGERAECIKEAIDWCIDNNILKEYLIRKRVEVTNMLIAEYNEEVKLAEIRKELEEEAEEKLKKERERADEAEERADAEKERAEALLAEHTADEATITVAQISLAKALARLKVALKSNRNNINY